jgi:predicted permease
MNLLVSILFSDILPIFAIAATGFLLARYAEADVKTISRVVFYALTPCLAFEMMMSAKVSGSITGRLVAMSALQMLIMGAIGFSAAAMLRLDRSTLRAFIMVVMFSNGGNYGLPVVRFAFGAEAMTYATIFFLTGSVMTYVSGAMFSDSKHGRVLGALDKIVRMPALYGLAAALIVLGTGQTVPDGIMRPVTMLGEAALPIMILVLGMQLERAVWPSRPGIVFLAVGMSLLIAPAVALGLAAMFGITGPARQAAVILASMPVAVVTTILALEFKLAPEFVTSAVFVSTVLSPLTLTPLIAYLS